MVARIQDAIDSDRPLTEGEQNFMTHELTESDLMSRGVDQDLAHEQAMQTHPTFANYDPEVIKQYSEYFNSNWLRYWGI
jgi:hypothetical protein